MDTKVTFQLIGIWRGIGTVRTLVGSFTSVASHMAFQLGQFDRRIIAFLATMWLFVRVTITDVTH